MEATQDLTLENREIETPLCTCLAPHLSSKVALIPVLRAGLGMVEGCVSMLAENTQILHLLLQRDHETLQPKTYYQKLGDHCTATTLYILDPMIGTGGTMSAAIEHVKQWRDAFLPTGDHAPRISALSLLACPDGLKRLAEDHPEVPIYTCAVDPVLNEVGYIVPGLGDAGDRIMNTL